MTLDPHTALATFVVVIVAAVGCAAVVSVGRTQRARVRALAVLPAASVRSWWPIGGVVVGSPAAGRRPAVVGAAASALLLASWVFGPILVVVIVGFVMGGLAVARHGRERSSNRRADAQLPGFLDELARCLRAGRSLPVAIEEAGEATPAPLGPGFVHAARRARLGVPLDESLLVLSAQRHSASLRLVLSALDLASTTGASHIKAVEGVATTVRDRLALAAEVRALASQATASAVVLVVAPLVFAVVIAMADPSTAQFLLGSPGGVACLVLGLALDVAGAWWMRRLTAAVR